MNQSKLLFYLAQVTTSVTMDTSRNLDTFYEERSNQLEEVKAGLERLKVNMNAMVRNMETMNAIGSQFGASAHLWTSFHKTISRPPSTFEQQPINQSAKDASSSLARDLDERSMGEEERL
ncbi:hypothetical protein MAM1_0151c06665 [Mucor ambiguus]|uniref:DASH complex subunit DAD1 n=1 Tax=Mucor ambiguus TaxID=91626 RepID=A0A0C9MUP9_9FUNG|nr:hypothetical protein MAM1_0151c06665 [Mucor ambiguus]